MSADGSASVNGLNGRLQLIAPHAFEFRRRPEAFFSLFNHRLRPEGGVLLVERDKLAVVRVARRTAGFTVQHERKQPERFGFGWHQLNQGSPDGDGVSCKSVMR